MVTVRQSHSAEYHPGGTQSWLSALGLPEAKISALLDAELWLHQQNLTDQEPEVQTGWEMVEILADLRMDKDALTAALLFPLVDAKLIELEQVETQFCSAVLAMLNAVRQMEAIRSIPVGPNQSSNPQQADNLRRMLLAMVEDVRAVVLKLAAQICYLRSVKTPTKKPAYWPPKKPMRFLAHWRTVWG